jgi:hypothetical protein
MAQPFGAADRNRELHYCSSARCRREFLTHDFSHLIGGHGLYGGSDVLSERIVDERPRCPPQMHRRIKARASVIPYLGSSKYLTRFGVPD